MSQSFRAQESLLPASRIAAVERAKVDRALGYFQAHRGRENPGAQKRWQVRLEKLDRGDFQRIALHIPADVLGESSSLH